MTKPLLKVSDATVRFGGLTAVDHVSFEVNEGELLGLIGPNGAGKTTALRAVTGVVQLSSGSVELDGQRIDHLSIDRRIRKGLSLSQQLVKPLRDMTLLENVVLAAGYNKTASPLKALVNVDDAAERKIAQAMLDKVGIGPLANQKPAIQPLGILKRLELARALALQPKLFLLDEPLAGLNSKEARDLASTIVELNKSGMTIVLIEHNLGEVIRVCQRLVVLDNGRKIADGEPRGVMNNSEVRAAYLGGDVVAEKGGVHASY
ncbi:MAG: ABC transporter ATP-binding protein [Hyphomicrobiaceae bacterium]|nr:ABC transporter ATP-binding protein [Hyphomicrobiaceae bacterium]